MAYADVSYYMDEYKGTVLTEENAGRYLDMASDVVDQLTFYRIHAILFENLTEFQKKQCGTLTVRLRISPLKTRI